MTSTADLEQHLLCSFCAKQDVDVDKIIAGPGIYICNECVRLCNVILDEDAATADPQRRAAPPELPYWQGLSDQKMLDHLPKIAAVADQVEGSLTIWVRRLRQRGVAWSRIGAALGMTRQSAWERFAGED